MTVPSADPQAAAPAPVLLTPPAPLLGLSAEEYRTRRQALRTLCPDGIIVLRGATEAEAVNPGRYQQNSTFLYFTGVQTPGSFLVLLPPDVPAEAAIRGAGKEIREILYIPARNAGMEAWNGPQLGPGADTEAATGIQKTADASGLDMALMNLVRRCPHVYFEVPFGPGNGVSRTAAFIEHCRCQMPSMVVKDASDAIGRLRMVKSQAEIDRTVEAIKITQAGHRAARKVIAAGDGLHEYVAEAAALQAFRSHGAGLAFGSIVGAGHNATVLHYEENNCPMKQGQLVVVDIGAKTGGYCGDITRTYPVGGKFGEREKAIYNTVLGALENAIATYKPGDTLQDLQDRCKAYYKAQPLRSKDAAGNELSLDNFYPHGLSHHLGIDVHDVGDRLLPLSPGCIITVEPGLYLPSEGIGVRIEDDYLVTETGLELLGPPLERTVEEIEAALAAE